MTVLRSCPPAREAPARNRKKIGKILVLPLKISSATCKDPRTPKRWKWPKVRSQKRTPKPKNRTNSTKEFSEQFEGVTGHYPLKQGLWGKSHQKVHPKVRRNLCRKSSLGYLFCPWQRWLKSGFRGSTPNGRTKGSKVNERRFSWPTTLLSVTFDPFLVNWAATPWSHFWATLIVFGGSGVFRWLYWSQAPLRKCCAKAVPEVLGNGRSTVNREYCLGEENSLSLTEFYGKLGEFYEKLGDFALAHK